MTVGDVKWCADGEKTTTTAFLKILRALPLFTFSLFTLREVITLSSHIQRHVGTNLTRGGD
jgi:hypothetical protein